MTPLALSRIHYPVTTLGPGARVGIWFQGCSIRCPGCISLDTWAPGRMTTSVEAVLAAVLPLGADADGLTVSGGEPFEQPDALHALLTGWRKAHGGDVLVYSGHSLEALRPYLVPFNGLIDALVADPFRRDLPQTLALRGSDNQRLVILTPLGEARFASYERPLSPGDRTLDVMFDDETGEVFLAGIPRPSDMTRLARLLQDLGHVAATTEDQRLQR